MKSLSLITLVFAGLFFVNGKKGIKEVSGNLIIGTGQMPSMAVDSRNNLYVVFGYGDSLMYSSSTDQGKSFSSPVLIAVLPQLSASAMRGPQIAFTSKGVIVIACNEFGNIYCFRRLETGKWLQTTKVNDVDSVAKEQFLSLGADGQYCFAAWLDLRNKQQEIFGAASSDGGKSWSKNVMIYTSPDTSVCECCKLSAAVKGNNVYVMFRNKLKGNRDLYLAKSSDLGKTFGKAQKLGFGTWALNGCPMDGGGLVIDKNNIPQTIWRRQSKIYSCEPGKPEIELGEGRGCTIETLNNKNVYAWTEKGEVVILTQKGIKKNLGKGQLPIIKATTNGQVICVWENERQIHTAIVSL